MYIRNPQNSQTSRKSSKFWEPEGWHEVSYWEPKTATANLMFIWRFVRTACKLIHSFVCRQNYCNSYAQNIRRHSIKVSRPSSVYSCLTSWFFPKCANLKHRLYYRQPKRCHWLSGPCDALASKSRKLLSCYYWWQQCTIYAEFPKNLINGTEVKIEKYTNKQQCYIKSFLFSC